MCEAGAISNEYERQFSSLILVRLVFVICSPRKQVNHVCVWGGVYGGGCVGSHCNEIKLQEKPGLFSSAANLNARRNERPKGSYQSMHELWITTADLFLLAVVSFH